MSVVTAIIALVLASGAEKEYQANHGKYSMASYKNLKAGKICAIIGLALVGVGILCVVAYVLLVGSLMTSFFHF